MNSEGTKLLLTWMDTPKGTFSILLLVAAFLIAIGKLIKAKPSSQHIYNAFSFFAYVCFLVLVMNIGSPLFEWLIGIKWLATVCAVVLWLACDFIAVYEMDILIALAGTVTSIALMHKVHQELGVTILFGFFALMLLKTTAEAIIEIGERKNSQ